MCSFAPVTTGAGMFVASSGLFDQYQYLVASNTTAYVYDPFEDGWTTLPSPALAGTFGAGTAGTRHPAGPRGFPTAGTTTTITTSLNLQRQLSGYVIRIIAGPNAGSEYTILRNTTGSNSIITITGTAAQAFTTASEFILVTGRLWVVNGGTLASGSFKYYDLATNTWNNATQTGLPATIGTDSRLVATPGYLLNNFVTATATVFSTTTIGTGSATWATNMWTNYQVRITSGTGAGQFRSIASNTATTLTVSSAWTTTPDGTSQYVIEGNDDYIYYLGNNAVTMYRYSISGNTWSTLSPVAARTGAPVAGMSAHWVYNVSDSSWSDLTGATNFLNGRYIYSFRGGAATLDRYDIAANTWESDVAYAPKGETLSSGSSYAYADDYIYVNLTNTGRVVKYNVAKQLLEPFTQLFYAQSTTALGDRFFDVVYTDGATKLRWLYFITHTQTAMFRILVF
jgi:hypothetical protein